MSAPIPGPHPENRASELSDHARAKVPGDVIDPLDLLVVLGRRRRMLFAWPVVAAAVAAVVSLVLPKTYTGVTTILPPQQTQSPATALLAQLGGLASAAGTSLGVKNPSDLYVAMLRSTTIADALIERFALKELYRERYQADARRALAERSRFVAEKSGVIVIEAEARDPKLAADLANAYVEELHRLTSTLAVTEAAQRRVFFEKQLEMTKDRLAEAEVRLRQAIESGGLVSVDAQSRAAVETGARLRALISAKEVQIGAMQAYATPNHPDRRRAEQELASLREELARLETGAGETGGNAADGSAGAGGVANIRLVREVKYHEVMFELLAKQLELARVDESKQAPLVQVMDRATPPEKRTRPKRTRMVLLAGVGAFLAALLTAFLLDALEGARRDPSRQSRFAELREVWRLRRRP